MKVSFLAFGLALATLANAPAAGAQSTPDFMAQVPPRRLALVVGNSDYRSAPKLPGSTVDADTMRGILTDLGFEVTEAKNVVTRSDFVENYLRPFMSQIEDGDVALFYFSGHGFAYGGENYITPLDFEVATDRRKIASRFLSTTGIERQMTDRGAGLVLIILDACRNIPGFRILAEDREDTAVSKGFAEPRARVASTVYWFSSALGATSKGSLDPMLSTYTKALVRYLPAEARDLDDVLREVRVSVMFDTDNDQVPWTSGTSSAQFYFKPTPVIIEDQTTIWKAVLQEGTRFAVTRFLEIYGTGPYGAAARRWLAENPNAPDIGVSTVSPVTAEVAWEQSAGGEVLLPRVGGALVPPSVNYSSITRDLTKGPGPNNEIVFATIGSRGSIFRIPPLRLPNLTTDIIQAESNAIANAGKDQLASASARTIDRLGVGVAVDMTDARATPSDSAPVTKTLQPGTAVTIEGLTVDDADRAWLEAKESAGGTSFYIEQSAAGLEPIEVGKAAREVQLLPKGNGVSSMVDDAPLVRALEQLAAEGTSVTWVAIATPPATTPGSDAVYGLQAIYVKSILAKAGVKPAIVTTSEGASPEGVRVRIFGRGGNL